MTPMERDAAAWRAVLLNGRPLVPPDIKTPRLVIAAALARLAALRVVEGRQ